MNRKACWKKVMSISNLMFVWVNRRIPRMGSWLQTLHAIDKLNDPNAERHVVHITSQIVLRYGLCLDMWQCTLSETYWKHCENTQSIEATIESRRASARPKFHWPMFWIQLHVLASYSPSVSDVDRYLPLCRMTIVFQSCGTAKCLSQHKSAVFLMSLSSQDLGNMCWNYS